MDKEGAVWFCSFVFSNLEQFCEYSVVPLQPVVFVYPEPAINILPRLQKFQDYSITISVLL